MSTHNDTDNDSTETGLATELDRIDGNVNGLYALFSDLKDRVAKLEDENERQRMMIQSLRTQTSTPDGEMATDGGVDE
ncbi:hypothetical protein [Haladaptatus salinisoli]|uniref:hypothetical protein n=1 Tax=Haladaptatus salinisoli TaxID=2884876 RepID=UPI001D0AA2D3|nr:hypothetical protein [Haladaptatus salinisoli]